MSKTTKPTVVINDWRIGAKGPRATVGGNAIFSIVDLDVSAILKHAEAAVLQALEAEGIRGDVDTLELRIEFERRERSTQTTIRGYVTLSTASQEQKI
jgi:hypothetical protein